MNRLPAPVDPFARAQRKPRSRRGRTLELLATGGLGAIVAMLAGTPPGWAQSFVGNGFANYNPNTCQYTATISSSAGATNIQVNQDHAIITWDTTFLGGTGTVNFQAANTTATFSSQATQLTDYTVLNIVQSSAGRPIQFNGTVNSEVYTAGGPARGGNIWFYNNNGIIVGATGRFNVGSLLLTTLSPDDQTTHFNEINVGLTGTAGSTAGISILPGAQITASNYIALTASHIAQGGALTATGEVAMATGETMTLTMPFGGNLFGIEVTTGSDATNPDGYALTHSGTTTGPANGSIARKVYLVAVPKNVATTMLLQGSIGYTEIGSAVTSADGTIVLAGADAIVTNGVANRPSANGTITAGSGLTFTSNTELHAPTINLNASTGDLAFAGNATVDALTAANITVASGRSLFVSGLLNVAAYQEDVVFNRTGGTITANIAGTFGVSGNLSFDVASQGFSISGSAGGSATGGTIGLTLNGGSIAGNLMTLAADGRAGDGDQGGNGTGGTINLTLNGGSLNLTSGASLTATGVGGLGELVGGAGQGGDITLTLAPASPVGPAPVIQTPLGTILLNADGAGGNASCASCMDGNGHYLDGSGANGGAGTGGNTRLLMSAGTLTSAYLQMSANGTGANALPGIGTDPFTGTYRDGGAGGAGQGGLARISQTGGTARITNVTVNTNGTGGNGADGTVDYTQDLSVSGNGGAGGDGIGGTFQLDVLPTTSATFNPSQAGSVIAVSSYGAGGNAGGSYYVDGVGGNGGNGTGGTATVQVGLGGALGASVFTLNTISTGGDGGAGVSVQGSGGASTGGNITVSQAGGTIAFTGNTNLDASGIRRSGGGNTAVGPGGTPAPTAPTFYGPESIATGAIIAVSQSAGIATYGTIIASASAYDTRSAPPMASIGGAGIGGRFVMLSTGGQTSFTSIIANAYATGGNALYFGGTATGGQVTLGASSTGQILGGGADFFGVSGVAGNSTANGTGGYGQGGTVSLSANNALLTLGTVVANASAMGGSGDTADVGRAGTVTIATRAGGTVSTSGGVSMLVTRQDGAGYIESSASGGAATIDIQSGSVSIGGPLNIDVSDLGDSTNGGVVNIQSISGTGAYASSSFGATNIRASGNSAGRVGIRNTAPAGNDLRFTSLDVAIDGFYIPSPMALLTSTGGRIAVTNNALFTLSGNFELDAGGPGGLTVGGNLNIASNDLVISHGSSPSALTVDAGLVDFNTGVYTQTSGTVSGGDVNISASQIIADRTLGGNSITFSANTVTVGTAQVNGAPTYLGNGDPTPGVAALTITAGSGGTQIGTAASASGTVSIASLGTIAIANGATIGSLNRIDLTTGGSVTLATGASVIAADGQRPGVGRVSIAAGDGSVSSTVAQPIYASNGTITGSGSVSLLADAIETTTSTITGGAVSAQLNAGNLTGDQTGLLSAACSGGNICLGAIQGTGAIAIGTTGRVPTNLYLYGNITGASIDARAASALFLGQLNQTRTLTITGAAAFAAGTGTLGDLGTVNLTAGSASFSAGVDVAASATNVLTTSGGITFAVPRNIYFASLRSAAGITSPTSGPITLTGLIDVPTVAVGNGGVFNIAASGGIRFNRVLMANGSALRLNAVNATLAAGDVSAGPSGQAATATLQGGNITLAGLATSGNATIIASSGTATITAPVTAGGTLTVNGAQGVTFTSLSGSAIGVQASAGAINGASIASSGQVTLTASGAIAVTSDIAANNVVADGATLALRSNAALRIANATTRVGGATLVSGGLTDITLATIATDLTATAGGPLTFGTLLANNVALTSASGGIGGNALGTRAGGTTMLTAPGSIAVTALNAGGPVTANGGDISLRSSGSFTLASAIASTGGIALVSGGALTVTSATAATDIVATAANPLLFTTLGGRNVTLTSTGGAITGQSLTASGTASFNAAGALTLSSLTAAGLVSGTANGITLASPGALAFATLNSGTGDATIAAINSLTLASFTGRNLSLNSTAGSVTASGLAGTGSVTFAAANGAITASAPGALTVASATSGAGGTTITSVGDLTTGPVTSPGAVALTSSGGNVAVGTVSAQTLALSAARGTISGGPLTVADTAAFVVSGALTLPTLTAGGAISITAGSIALSSPGALNLGTIVTGTGDATFSAVNALTLASFTGRNLSLTSSAGSVTASGLAGTGSVTFDASNGGVTATAPGALTLASILSGAGGATITSVGDLTAGPIGSTGGVTLTSSNGNVTVGSVTISTAAAKLPTGGIITTQAVATGDLVVAAARTATFNGTQAVRGAIQGSATDLVLNGTMTAPTLAFASQTVAIGNAARVGLLGTTGSVNFRNSGAGRSTLGGTGATGYTISAAALSRIQGTSISFDLPAVQGSSATSPDVTLGTFAIGSSGLPANGSFIVRTPGRVQVAGAVSSGTFTNTNTLRIEGGQGIDVVTPAGSILLADASGTPAGSLELVAPTVRVGTTQALADVAAASSIDARAARLATNDGAVNDQGFLQANRLLLQVSNAVLVQNSGGSAFVDRRGVTVGSGGLVITATGNALPEVILSGRLRNADGSFTTGGDVGGRITLAGASALASGSAVNGCSVLTGCVLAPVATNFFSAVIPQQDVVGIVDDADDDEKDGEERPTDPVLPTMTPLIQIARPIDFEGAEQANAPITGTGNDVLWITGVGTDLGGSDGVGIGVGTGSDGPLSSTTGGADRGQGGTSFGVGADRGPGAGGDTGGSATGPGAQSGGGQAGPQGGGVNGGQEGRPGGTGAGNPGDRTQGGGTAGAGATGGVNGTSADQNRTQGTNGATGAGGNGGTVIGPNDRAQGQTGAGGANNRTQNGTPQ